MDRYRESSAESESERLKEVAYAQWEVKKFIEAQVSVVERPKIVRGNFVLYCDKCSQLPCTSPERKIAGGDTNATYKVRIHGAFLEGFGSGQVFILTEFDIKPQG